MILPDFHMLWGFPYPAPRTGSLAHPSLRHDAVGVRRLLQGPANSDGPRLKLQEPIEHLQVIHGETMLYVMIYDDYDS